MAPPIRRPWPATLPLFPCAGLLALASVAGYGLVVLAPGALGALELVPAELGARPWAALTYSFVQADVVPLVASLAALLVFAPRLEARAGGARLLGFYGAGAAIGVVLALANPEAPMTGSAAATIGVLVGFARYCPEEAVLPPLQFRGRLPAAGLAAAVLLTGLPDHWSALERGLACAALLGGFMLLGRPARPAPVRQVEAPNSHFNIPGVQHPDTTTPWDSIDLDALHEVNRAVVEDLLGRARALGPTHLTPMERELLDRMKGAAAAAER